MTPPAISLRSNSGDVASEAWPKMTFTLLIDRPTRTNLEPAFSHRMVGIVFDSAPDHDMMVKIMLRNRDQFQMPSIFQINRLKSLFLATLFAPLVAQGASACKGLDEPEIKDVIAAARELAEFVESDEKFPSIKDMSSEDQKAANLQAAMQPIDFSDLKHRIDRYALGDVVVESKVEGGTQTLQGSGYKISRSCVVTAAHVLYPTINQQMSEKNRAAYNGKISFVRGDGQEKQETPATVFFQMTKSDDYRMVSGERRFKGSSDIVVLRLSEADNYFKPVTVISPDNLLKNVDSRVGRKISCMGSPSHMTQKKYGNCNGTEFKWKQENARIFSEDISSMKLGVRTNLAGTHGMSGGSCFFVDIPSQVIGLFLNGYQSSEIRFSTMPNINLESTDTNAKNIRHIATFDLLNERMKAELGYGLKDLDQQCK